ncbi:MAG TPA: phosphorylase [Candidatus Angelobacter sp.]|nr:phosphorylase [Candidatus Angelobacter sp.]
MINGPEPAVEVAIIAAMERELAPLISDWDLAMLETNGRPFICYEGPGVVAVFAGMGCQRAEEAATAAVKRYSPRALVSAGLAGALLRSLKVGNVVLPNVIINAASGIEYRCNLGGDVIGGGVLVSNFEITGRRGKAELVECFHALVVDMEAAGVAQVAMENELRFRCVKAVSDELDFEMPPLNQFVSGGELETGRLARWAAVRPRYWPAMLALARNSRRASRALCDWLRTSLATGLQTARVVTLNGEYLKG